MNEFSALFLVLMSKLYPIFSNFPQKSILYLLSQILHFNVFSLEFPQEFRISSVSQMLNLLVSNFDKKTVFFFESYSHSLYFVHRHSFSNFSQFPKVFFLYWKCPQKRQELDRRRTGHGRFRDTARASREGSRAR